MERDKSLMTLSAAAIGLLVTLLTTVGAKSLCLVVLYASAIISFTCALITTIQIFDRNAVYLEKIAKGNDKNDERLVALDKRLYTSFIIGVVLTLLIGTVTGLDQLTKTGENKMTDEKSQGASGTREHLLESLEGLDKLRPVNQGGVTVQKSLQGLSNLRTAQPAQPTGGRSQGGHQSTADTSSDSSSSGETQSGPSTGQGKPSEK
jgi:hypothetical protein